MRKIILGAFLAAFVAFPTAAPAASSEKSPAQQCRAERTADADAFKQKYGTNRTKSNAFGKCVSQKRREARQERRRERRQASRECRAERAADAEAFKQKYGTNRNKSNAFGKCVSAKVREGNSQS